MIPTYGVTTCYVNKEAQLLAQLGFFYAHKKAHRSGHVAINTLQVDHKKTLK